MGDLAAVRAALDRWSAVYGVDPKLARATAWMESGFRQDVVSSVGAVGVSGVKSSEDAQIARAGIAALPS